LDIVNFYPQLVGQPLLCRDKGIFSMFQLFASLLFATALFGSIAVIALMARAYRTQALAALRWKPDAACAEPLAPVYNFEVRTRRTAARPITLAIRPAPYRPIAVAA
jgi:hypothetical protein